VRSRKDCLVFSGPTRGEALLDELLRQSNYGAKYIDLSNIDIERKVELKGDCKSTFVSLRMTSQIIEAMKRRARQN